MQIWWEAVHFIQLDLNKFCEVAGDRRFRSYNTQDRKEKFIKKTFKLHNPLNENNTLGHQMLPLCNHKNKDRQDECSPEVSMVACSGTIAIISIIAAVHLKLICPDKSTPGTVRRTSAIDDIL